MGQPAHPDSETIQVYPKDIWALPGHPEAAVSWPGGFRREPMLDLRRRQFITLLGVCSSGVVVCGARPAGDEDPAYRHH